MDGQLVNMLDFQAIQSLWKLFNSAIVAQEQSQIMSKLEPSTEWMLVKYEVPDTQFKEVVIFRVI